MRISDWSSDVCSSDLLVQLHAKRLIQALLQQAAGVLCKKLEQYALAHRKHMALRIVAKNESMGHCRRCQKKQRRPRMVVKLIQSQAYFTLKQQKIGRAHV